MLLTLLSLLQSVLHSTWVSLLKLPTNGGINSAALQEQSSINMAESLCKTNHSSRRREDCRPSAPYQLFQPENRLFAQTPHSNGPIPASSRKLQRPRSPSNIDNIS